MALIELTGMKVTHEVPYRRCWRSQLPEAGRLCWDLRSNAQQGLSRWSRQWESDTFAAGGKGTTYSTTWTRGSRSASGIVERRGERAHRRQCSRKTCPCARRLCPADVLMHVASMQSSRPSRHELTHQVLIHCTRDELS